MPGRMCCFSLNDGRPCFPISDTDREQADCELQGGHVVASVGPGPIPIPCAGKAMAYAANEIDPTAFYNDFQAIAFSQPCLLMDMYLNKFETGKKLVNINYHIFREKALPIIVDDKALLEEGMHLIALSCHFANQIVINKLSEKTTGAEFIFSQRIYDLFDRFAEKILGRTSDPELKESIDFVLTSLMGIVGKSVPELIEFLDEAVDNEA